MRVVSSLKRLQQFKRWRAPVKRDLMVWMYDVSKQGFGAMFIHVWNILLSIHEVLAMACFVQGSCSSLLSVVLWVLVPVRPDR